MRLTTLLITLTLFSACREKQSRNLQLQEQTVTGDRVEVIYFHGKQRCMTCKSIEAQTKELLTGSLAEAVKTGQIVYRTVDISDKEGEKIADRYEVTWSSLFVNRWKDGQEQRNNMTEFAFSKATSDPEGFKAGLKEKIEILINNERARWSVEGTDVETMSIGNSVGGLTTIEEKSLGALHKMGTKPIQDVLQINKDFIEKPTKAGFYLSEVTMLCGGAGVNYAALGAHIILWTSGAAGFNNAIVPVIRVSGNSDLMNDDIDVNVAEIMEGTMGISQGADLIVQKVLEIANGTPTKIENYGDSTMTLYQKDQRVEKMLNLKCVNK